MYQRFRINFGLISFLALLEGGVSAFLAASFLPPLITVLKHQGDGIPFKLLISLAFLNMLWIGSFVMTVWFILSGISTYFSEEGVEQRSVLGKKLINWTSVTSVRMLWGRVTIKSSTQRIRVNLHFYRDPEEVVYYIDNHTQHKDFGC